MVPVIWSAPLLPLAPPCLSFISAVDLPPAMESVETDQPAPNFASVVPSSKLLMRPDSEPAGAGAPRGSGFRVFSFAAAARDALWALSAHVFPTARPSADTCEVLGWS